MSSASAPRRNQEVEQTASDCSQKDETASTKRSETAMTNTKHTTPQIPIKDFYTVDDVAILLCTGKDRISELANREHDPLPFRCFSSISRGMFIYRPDLAEWVMRNTDLARFRKLKGASNDARR